jgi:hypothetical protein
VFVTEQFLIQQELLYAQAQGDIALGLMTVDRALGGGWELRLAENGMPDGAGAAPCLSAPVYLGLPQGSVSEQMTGTHNHPSKKESNEERYRRPPLPG